MCDVIGLDVAMKDSSFHVFDYNPFRSDDRLSSYFMSFKNIYAMKQFWFKSLLGILILTGLGLSGFLLPGQAEAYQDVPTPTGIFVTVTYTDPINVRSGPSTVQYPIVAQLNDAINKVSSNPEVAGRMRNTFYAEPETSTPARLRTFLDKELAKWTVLAKTVKLSE